jgi:hypothetical protein
MSAQFSLKNNGWLLGSQYTYLQLSAHETTTRTKTFKKFHFNEI